MKVELQFSGFTQALLIDNQPFYAKIFSQESLPPEGFNAVKISLDASLTSLLQWQSAAELAEKLQAAGIFILWELSFQLESIALDDEVALMTLQLNVRHFCDTIFKQFEATSLGVALYKGEWQLEYIEYVKALAAQLTDEATAFVFIDTTHMDAAALLQSVTQESLGHLVPFLKGPLPQQFPFAVPALAWDHGYSPLGFCATTSYEIFAEKPLPEAFYLTESLSLADLNQVLSFFDSKPFRVIPENLLSQEWEGIDTLWLLKAQLSEKAERQLRGFQAAGGEYKIIS